MKNSLIAGLVGLLMSLLLILGFLFDPAYVYGNELTPQERELIAKTARAEAEGEGEFGQRLVIDAILNRVDHGSFPDSVQEVIFQEGQFANPSEVLDEDILFLVFIEELERTNNQVIFFRTDKYPSYGEPLFKEGNHYFTKF